MKGLGVGYKYSEPSVGFQRNTWCKAIPVTGL
jgi:hypothetical protein